MRFLVLALMIALLPLRGWAGEVMATEMASTQVVRAKTQAESATKLIASNANTHWTTGTFEGKKTVFEAAHTKTSAIGDCEGHAKVDEAASAVAHCDSCPACQACHTVALSVSAVDLNFSFSSHTLLRPAAAHFASATAALGQKPPIS